MHHGRVAALHDSRYEQGLLARRVRKLRAREVRNAADDLGDRVALCAYWANQALATRAQARVARKHDRHSEGGFFVDSRRRTRE